MHSGSDIDIAILVDEKRADALKVQLRSMSNLSALLEKEVDIQNLEAVDVEFAHMVISEGKLLFARLLEDKVSYETEILRKYFDLKTASGIGIAYLAELTPVLPQKSQLLPAVL